MRDFLAGCVPGRLSFLDNGLTMLTAWLLLRFGYSADDALWWAITCLVIWFVLLVRKVWRETRR